MPLPAAEVSRTRTHVRRISLEGWRRDDGLWDIEARLTDVKDQDFPLASGVRAKGDPVHDMHVRATIDQQMNIIDLVAAADWVPYPGGCDTITPAYSRLKGLNLFSGFRQAVNEQFKNANGCTHITELLHSLPTAALQTLVSESQDVEGNTPGVRPFQLDRCHALESTSETVRRYYPRWFRSKKTGT